MSAYGPLTQVNDAAAFFCLNLTTFLAPCAGQKEVHMSVTINLVIILGVLSAAVAAAFLWTRHRRKSGSFEQDVGVPEGTSFLDALLHCATCPRVVSCHRYIETQQAKTGRVERFCPRSDFLLRLTGRQKGRGTGTNA